MGLLNVIALPGSRGKRMVIDADWESRSGIDDLSWRQAGGGDATQLSRTLVTSMLGKR